MKERCTFCLGCSLKANKKKDQLWYANWTIYYNNILKFLNTADGARQEWRRGELILSISQKQLVLRKLCHHTKLTKFIIFVILNGLFYLQPLMSYSLLKITSFQKKNFYNTFFVKLFSFAPQILIPPKILRKEAEEHWINVNAI